MTASAERALCGKNLQCDLVLGLDLLGDVHSAAPYASAALPKNEGCRPSAALAALYVRLRGFALMREVRFRPTPERSGGPSSSGQTQAEFRAHTHLPATALDSSASL